MSGGITSIADFGKASRLATASSQIKQQLDLATEQTSTGLVSNSYSGLGSGAAVSLSLNPQIAEAKTWQSNINGATAAMSSTQNVMTELSSIASNFSSDLVTMTSTGGASIDVIAGEARQALQQVGTLLNTQVGNNYIFSGQDASNPAVPNAQNILSSSYFMQIQSAVAGLGTNGATATTAAALAAATAPATAPFDPTIGSTPATVEIGTDQRVQTGILANANSDATSTPSATSTGSYMQDLMLSLASIGSLSSSQAASAGAAFQSFLGSIGTTLKGAITGLNTDSSMLGSRQSELSTRGTDLSDTVTALTDQVSNVQNVDTATMATKLSQLQTQLQASYKMIADLGQFSLVTFMPNA